MEVEDSMKIMKMSTEDLFLKKTIKFVWGIPKWKISTRREHISCRKKSGEVTLPPLKNITVMPLGIQVWDLPCISVDTPDKMHHMGCSTGTYLKTCES